MTRTEELLTRYGEAVKRSTAAHIIDCAPRTIAAMLADGRLRAACAGTRVDVRSISEYIENPAAMNRAARLKSRWHV